MKSCPTCSRTFEDTFTFCLIDGAVLSAPLDPQATRIIHKPRQHELPTEVLQPQDILPAITSPQLDQKPEKLVSTVTAPAPAFESPQIKVSPTQVIRKSARSSLIMLGVGVLLVISLPFFIISNRTDGENENASNTTSPPLLQPVLKLEGTVWKTKRQDIQVSIEDVLEFRGNGEITKRTGGDTQEGTWRLQGNKVWIDFPAKHPFASIKVEATIEGEEMKGNFDIAAGLINASFTARKI